MFVKNEADTLIQAVTYVKENLADKVELLAEKVIEAFKKGNKVILMGNGGSAADAQHIAAEFVGRFKKERPSFPALALNTNTSTLTAVDLALRMKDMGVTTIIYTDVSRDGMMQGPNVEATRRLIEQTGMDIIGSGGVSCLDDLRNLRDAGCAGAILGRAMYEGAFSVEEALSAVKEA